jgi:chorismate dehydratase
MEEIDLIIDFPSRIADMLLKDEIDMGLVPVAVIPQLKEYYINGGYCIGSDGPVASVCLFSELPLEKLDRVLLDYQSRTSVRLARILLEKYWHVSPELEDGGNDFREQIKGTTGGVVIGDRALEQRTISPYIYDLGEAWKAMTGLPFVFAAWISNKPLDPGFVSRFDQANLEGLLHFAEVVAQNPYDNYPLREYFTRNLDYHLDSRKQAGLEKFLQYIAS